MPALRDILDRFRPAPGPGRAGPVGVPSATTFTGADELRPVFAALDDVVARCEAIREEGRRQAAEIRQAADLRLASLRSQAATTADQVEAASMAAVKAAGQARQVAELAAARREAAHVRADGVEKMTPYIAAAVLRVRSLPGSRPVASDGIDGS
jgi:hypothetical protein